MLSLKISKEKNKMIKLLFNILFIVFIICNGIWNIKTKLVLSEPILILLFGLIPLILGILGSSTIFYIFKNKDGLKFALGTIFSMIMYYVFWNMGIIVMIFIGMFSTFFE